MQVVFNHYVLAYAPGWYPVTPIGFVADGASAVLLFFLMSGLVLTYSFERTPNALAGGLARRYIRLGLPLAAAVLFGLVIHAALPGLNAAVAPITGSTWMASANVSTDLGRAMADLSGLTMLTGYSDATLFDRLSYCLPSILTSADNPIWSLHIEFWGSVLVLGLIWARARSKILHIAVLCASVVLIGDNTLILFVLGHLSALLIRTDHFRRWQEWPWVSLAACATLVLGIWLCEDHNLQPGIRNYVPGVWRIGHVATWGNILSPYPSFTMMAGAIMVYAAVLFLPAAHRICSTRVPAWLGRLSFPIYLLHWPIVMTVGNLTFLFVSPLGRWVAGSTALLVGLLVTLPLAVLFERFVDQPAIELSRMVGRFVIPKRAPQT